MRPGLILILLLMSLRGWGQGIMWENRFGWFGPDQLTDVIPADSGNYIACGTRYIFGHSYGDWVSNICIVKINSQGDTLWLKSMNMDGYSPRLCVGNDSSFYLVATAAPTPSADQLTVFRINFDGQIIFRQVLAGTTSTPYCNKIIQARNGSLYLVGSRIALSGTGNQNDMFIARVNARAGFVYFNKRYSDHPFTVGCHIEETATGTLLASGTAGSRIWAIEIDTNGAEIRRQTFYQTPTLALLFDGVVKQAPGGRYVVSGVSLSFTPSFFILGNYSTFSFPSKNWGGETRRGGLTPHILDDGSLVVYNGSGSNWFLTKLDNDSGRVWHQRVQSQLGPAQPVINALAYLPDSSAIGVGKMVGEGNDLDNFYLCRIKNVGVPYNPSEPVANKPRHKGLPPLIAYPNPSSGLVTIHTRSRQLLAVYSLSGQKRLEVQADSSGTTMLDLAGLPRGMYLLRQGENSIKLIKH